MKIKNDDGIGKMHYVGLAFENINDAKSTDITANVYKTKEQPNNHPEYEECLSCQ